MLSFVLEPVLLVGKLHLPNDVPPNDNKKSLIDSFVPEFIFSAEITKLYASKSIEMFALLMLNLDAIDFLHESTSGSQIVFDDDAFEPSGKYPNMSLSVSVSYKPSSGLVPFDESS